MLVMRSHAAGCDMYVVLTCEMSLAIFVSLPHQAKVVLRNPQSCVYKHLHRPILLLHKPRKCYNFCAIAINTYITLFHLVLT